MSAMDNSQVESLQKYMTSLNMTNFLELNRDCQQNINSAENNDNSNDNCGDNVITEQLIRDIFMESSDVPVSVIIKAILDLNENMKVNTLCNLISLCLVRPSSDSSEGVTAGADNGMVSHESAEDEEEEVFIMKQLVSTSYDELDDFCPRHPLPKDKTHRRGNSYFNSDVSDSASLALAAESALGLSNIAKLALEGLDDEELPPSPEVRHRLDHRPFYPSQDATTI